MNRFTTSGVAIATVKCCEICGCRPPASGPSQAWLIFFRLWLCPRCSAPQYGDDVLLAPLTLGKPIVIRTGGAHARHLH